MPKQRKEWHVVKKGDDWAVKRAGARQVTSRGHSTQREAANAAETIARNEEGGGLVVIHRPARPE